VPFVRARHAMPLRVDIGLPCDNECRYWDGPVGHRHMTPSGETSHVEYMELRDMHSVGRWVDTSILKD
jgi:hypothetical protein